MLWFLSSTYAAQPIERDTGGFQPLRDLDSSQTLYQAGKRSSYHFLTFRASLLSSQESIKLAAVLASADRWHSTMLMKSSFIVEGVGGIVIPGLSKDTDIIHGYKAGLEVWDLSQMLKAWGESLLLIKADWVVADFSRSHMPNQRMTDSSRPRF